mgnify:FL=1
MLVLTLHIANINFEQWSKRNVTSKSFYDHKKFVVESRMNLFVAPQETNYHIFPQDPIK